MHFSQLYDSVDHMTVLNSFISLKVVQISVEDIMMLGTASRRYEAVTKCNLISGVACSHTILMTGR